MSQLSWVIHAVAVASFILARSAWRLRPLSGRLHYNMRHPCCKLEMSVVHNPAAPRAEERAMTRSKAPNVRVLLVTGKEDESLRVEIDATRLMELSEHCGIVDITCLSDDFDGITKSDVLAEWNDLVSRCQPGETSVFYFSGHGNAHNGLKLSPSGGDSAKLKSDDMIEMLRRLPDGFRALIITDCCKSGDMLSLNSTDLGSRQVVHLAASANDEPAFEYEGANGGGVFTSLLLEVIAHMSAVRADKIREGAEPPTVKDLFRWTAALFDRELSQTFTMSNSPNCDPDEFPWPLWPKEIGYQVETNIWTVCSSPEHVNILYKTQPIDEDDWNAVDLAYSRFCSGHRIMGRIVGTHKRWALVDVGTETYARMPTLEMTKENMTIGNLIKGIVKEIDHEGWVIMTPCIW